MLNKDEILSKTNNGLDFFKFVIKDLQVNGNRCKNCKNPFYDDTKASLSIFKHDSTWVFKDFGDNIFHGDVFHFAAYYYNLDYQTDFYKILNNINYNLKLNLTSSMEDLTTEQKQFYRIKQNNKSKAIEYLKSRGITKGREFYYSEGFKNYPDAVVFPYANEKGFNRRFIATKDELEQRNLDKSKCTGPKKDTVYVGAYRPEQDTIFICEGEINSLSFYELGYSSISTFGASNIPSAEILKKFIENKIVILAGDGDKAGDKFNTDIAILIVKNGINVQKIKVILFPEGKDANDLLLSNELINFENITDDICIDTLKEKIKEIQQTDNNLIESKPENSETVNIQKVNSAVPLNQLIERAKSAPPIPFIWGGIKQNSFGFIFGSSKSGKTIFCENLAMSLAAQQDNFLGQRIEKNDYKVLFISLEEFWQQRTIRNSYQAAKLSKDVMFDYWQQNYIVVNEDCPRIIATEEDWTFIENLISENNPNIVFIDSLSRLYQGGIEDSKLAKEISFRLREISNKYNITLIVIHHTPKQVGKPLTIDSLAGSRILAQEADFMIGIGKTLDGKRYIKEIAFRYKQEKGDEVIPFEIDNDLWIYSLNSISETEILKPADGRKDDTNLFQILDFITEKSGIDNKEVTTSMLLKEFVETDIMGKQTLYNNIKKLLAADKIYQKKKGVYTSSPS